MTLKLRVKIYRKKILERAVGVSVTKDRELVCFVGQRVNAVKRIFGDLMSAKKMKGLGGIMFACDKKKDISYKPLYK